MGYVLRTEAMRVVNRNERGVVTYRKRYRRGDEVDTSKMDEAHVEALIKKGTLVSSEDDLPETESAGATTPVSPPFGAATAPSTPGTLGPDADEIEGSTPDDGTEDADTADADVDEEEHDVDAYDSMDYAALQAEAKKRDLNAGGSAQDLRVRLRADDES